MMQSTVLRSPISAFYINLDRDTARRNRMEEELSCVSIRAERIAAVDGRAVPEWLRSYYDHRMAPGEVGCSASHLTICKLIVERDLPFALILEDDARIEADCITAVDNAVQQAPGDWDVIRLIETSSRPIQELAQIGGGRALVRYLRVPRCTTGLIVSQSGARKLLTRRLVKEPIDVEIRWPWQLDLNVYGIHPPLITQASGKDIETSIPERSRPQKLNQLRRIVFNIQKMGLLAYLSCCLASNRNSPLPTKAVVHSPESFAETRTA